MAVPSSLALAASRTKVYAHSNMQAQHAQYIDLHGHVANVGVVIPSCVPTQERLRQQTQESKRQRQAGSAAAEAALQAALEEVRHHQHVATAAAEDAVAAEDRASAAEARAAAAEATLAAAETKLAEHTAEAQQAAERAAAAMVLQRRFRTRRAAQQAADAACRQQVNGPASQRACERDLQHLWSTACSFRTCVGSESCSVAASVARNSC